jgi:L-lactate dehydrogenase complex protein LldE
MPIFTNKMMEVQLFIPCFIDQLYPKTAFNTIKLLENAGCKVHYNPEQTCCGQPAFNSGYWDEASKLARKFLTDFNNDMPIVAPSGSCTGYVINHYHKVLKDFPEYIQKHENIKAKIFELSDFLLNILEVKSFPVSFPHKVTFHDACSALREYGIKDEPRQLLRMVEGLELIEMPESDTCCGFGGTFAIKNTAISTAMSEKKVLNALKTGVEYIVSTEASCLMNINGYISKNKLNIRGVHLADVLSGSII